MGYIIERNPTQFTVEIELLKDVYWQARAVQLAHVAEARAQGEYSQETMAWLGRRILKMAASAGTDPVMFQRILDMPPASRPPGAERKTFRFRMIDFEYAQAVGVLADAERVATAALPPRVSKEQGKRSVARWIEYHLEQYATTGKIE